MAKLLSKSRYLNGLQCSKLLWYYCNAREEIPQPDAGQQAIFDQGTEVGLLAQQLFPDGMLIKAEFYDYSNTIKQTKEALGKRVPLFEAGFEFNGAYCRSDVLKPVGKNQWDIIEVKSSTEVKDVYLADAAFQRYVFEGAGLKIRSCWICHINNQYVRKGPIDPKQLFTIEDVTELLEPFAGEIAKNLSAMQKTIAAQSPPNIAIGPHCSDPYECPLTEKCWSYLPRHNVFTLYRLGRKGFDLLEQGIEKITDIPGDYHLTSSQQIQAEAVRKGKEFKDLPAINAFLNKLKYPLYYLDFETFATAVPLYDNCSPYNSIPFQFSLHAVNKPGAKPKHVGYLAPGDVDPRPEILRQLKELLGSEGSIVAYNMPFEKSRLNEMAEVFAEYRKWNESIQARFVDLLEPFRAFAYYHPQQMGSASIKAVLPVVVGTSYEEMEIGDGGTASEEYLRITFGECSEKERKRVRALLEAYCKQDTLAMVEIVGKLTSWTNE